MKFRLLLFALLFTTGLYSQTDTILYFSKSHNPVASVDEAVSYEKLVRTSDTKFALSNYNKIDGKWKKVYETKIKWQTDTSYILASEFDNLRTFQKVDSGYVIRDFSLNNPNFVLNWTGFSRTLFPLVRSGIWKSYNPVTGDLGFENLYDNNLLLSTKYWINDTTFIKDVFMSFDETPEFVGGEPALMSLLYSNLNYPEESRRKQIQGRIMVGIVLLKNGQIMGVKPVNSVDKLLEQEAVRVVSLTQKKWIPAKIDGKNVNSFMVISCSFVLK
jgi:TonB family protein